MGTYLNPGTRNYRVAIESNVFVDKTEMIRFLNSVANTKQRYVSVSRPRRFGKTTAADMLCAYYGQGTDLRDFFETSRLAQTDPVVMRTGEVRPWDAYLGACDVVRVTMTDFFNERVSAEESHDLLQGLVAREVCRAYPEADYFDKKNLALVMDDAYEHTGRPFVVIIDEWDAPMRERPRDEEGQRAYLDFLRDWLKDKQWLALAYMTGILPIKKYGKHSALNMFDEYSMTEPLQMAPFTGFTEEEVRELCEEWGRDFQTMQDWYDGYEVRGPVPRGGTPEDAAKYALYAPVSVVKATTNGIYAGYWGHTETYEALERYIRMDFDGLRQAVALMMAGGRVPARLTTYQNGMTNLASRDDVIALLVHLGYLGWDERTGEAFVPNREIREIFEDSTRDPMWDAAFAELERSKELVRAAWEMDANAVAEALEAANDEAANGTYNSEAALSYAVQLAFWAARIRYTKAVELDSGKGYADLAYLPAPAHPEAPALVVELKHGGSPTEAIAQIRDRGYVARLSHYADNMLLVGISYDPDAHAGSNGYKRHSCVIERA